MGDEWEEINLASLHDNPGSREDPTRINNYRSHNFQEFLARPSNNTDLQTTASTRGRGRYSSPESPLPPPATALSLNSCPAHPFSFPLRSNSFFQPQPVFPNAPNSLNLDPFDSLAYSRPRLPDFGQKRSRVSEIGNSGDRRNNRMIKNRESAARSRARKQAYTTELELEVAHLMEENASLKRQQQQLVLAAAPEAPKKHGFHRSSTAPF